MHTYTMLEFLFTHTHPHPWIDSGVRASYVNMYRWYIDRLCGCIYIYIGYIYIEYVGASYIHTYTFCIYSAQTNTHISTYICIFEHQRTYTYLCTNVCVFRCKARCFHVYIYLYEYAHTHTHEYVYIHMYTLNGLRWGPSIAERAPGWKEAVTLHPMFIHTCIYVHVYIYAHTHKCIYIYTSMYKCIQVWTEC